MDGLVLSAPNSSQSIFLSDERGERQHAVIFFAATASNGKSSAQSHPRFDMAECEVVSFPPVHFPCWNSEKAFSPTAFSPIFLLSLTSSNLTSQEITFYCLFQSQRTER
ncbi:hypothetical protein KUCAC02_008558 [Chaenocephalus aceratus]|uniref:Uncharacterized protein n=1 Tax=Chaenocephalus aceratus TaxID=36190 RepID=A0ACB9WQP9_CHAAC|nr:hypothetical protein KUCAC02_008558 [Chaenocephalus aceratus]